MAPKGPTRADVARVAGVSVAAVSYAFDPRNGKISPTTRKRILAVASELGYRPNRIAGGLRRGRTDLVGMMVPDITNPFFSELARAVENECHHYGLMLLLASVDNDPAREEEYVRSLADMQVTGIIVTSTGTGGTSSLAYKTVRSSGIPYVRLDRNQDGDDTSNTIAVDNTLGAKMATNHLLRHGRRRLLCIAGPQGIWPADQRAEGFLAASSEVGETSVQVRHGEFSFESGYQIAKEIAAGPEPLPDGIFACSDVQALGALQALQEMGHDVPERIALIGFDGAREARYSRPALSTIVQPITQLAELAVRTIVSWANGVEPQPGPVLLEPYLVRRSSCGCVWDGIREEVIAL